VKRYTVYIRPQAWKEIKKLPGNVRHRIKSEIDSLAANPRPSKSKELDVSELPEFDSELRRVRLERWRIVYAVSKTEKIVDILAIRRRPPYDYGDLAELLGKLK